MVTRRILIIAGSDSSGGAGLEADQKVIAAHGCYAMTATTALTAQNTQGVRSVHLVPPVFLRQQIDACLEDVGADVIKIGMLGSAETIQTVAAALEDHKESVKAVVLDPVMVATSGAELLPAKALGELRKMLIPRATVLTPNLPEACLLLGGVEGADSKIEVESAQDLEAVAHRLRSELGARWVLVKGGHCPLRRSDGRVAQTEDDKEIVLDLLVGPADKTAIGEESHGAIFRLQSPYQPSRNTHGTGCSLASAIACNLAMGMPVPRAVQAACRYVEAGIRTAPGLGRGNGPLNHFHSVYTLPFAPGHFVSYLLERPEVVPVWEHYIAHPFVLAMGNGTLPLKSFKSYLVQDYLCLVHFARANALASYKSRTMTDIAAGAASVRHIARETNLHTTYCQSFGLTLEDLNTTEEKQACTAYTRYVLDIGQSQDWLGLQVALAPCLLGYGVLAARLHASAEDSVVRGAANRYWAWIENYVAEDYATAVRTGRDLLERHAVSQSPARIEELVKIFLHATKMEIGFWEMFPYADEP